MQDNRQMYDTGQMYDPNPMYDPRQMYGDRPVYDERQMYGSNRFHADVVRGRLLKLDSGHVGYVLNCLKNNTSKVVNIKKYMLAALFNAQATITSYYQAEVRHDLPQYAGGNV